MEGAAETVLLEKGNRGMSIANISLLIEDDYTVADLIKNLDGVDEVFVYRNGAPCVDLTIDILHSFVKFYEITKHEKEYHAEIWI